jgi:CheY-like chemotaxis protein
MSQVISNLILNARQAMPEGGVIKVSADNIRVGKGDTSVRSLKEGEYIKISVEDCGVGIEKKYLDKIFDPYFTTKQKGSGLGLATAYSIIKSHGGHITAESQPGVGTTFYIYLPASKKEVPKYKDREEIITSIRGEKYKGTKVLVMDDEVNIRDISREMLTYLGCEVVLAVDGDEAIELYRKARESGDPFDAILMDLTIPGGMGGKEAIKKLLEIDPEVKAIVSSGYSNDPVMAEYKKYGFSGIIAKPYNVMDLSEKLQKLIAGEDE